MSHSIQYQWDPLGGVNKTVNSFDEDDVLAEKPIAATRVVRKRGKVFLTGGSNVTLPVCPKSAYSLRPEYYKGLIKTEEICKAGLPEIFRLDVNGKNKNVTLTPWIEYIRQYI